MLPGLDRPEPVLHDPRPLPPVPLYSGRSDGGEAKSSVLSREDITPLPVSELLSSANFASFFRLICVCRVFVESESEDHLGVDDVSQGGHQHQPQQDVEAGPRHAGLTQPRRPGSHGQEGHEAEVETLEEGPGVQLGEEGGPRGDVGEEEQHRDQHRTRHGRGTGY